MSKKNKVKNTIELIHQATTVKITFCYGAKAYSKYMQKQHGLSEQIEQGGVTTIVTNNNTGEYALVVGIKEFKDVYVLKALLVHELSHTVIELMNEYGFKCDEFRSYTLQWLYQEIMPSLDARLFKDSIKRDKKAHKKSKK